MKQQADPIGATMSDGSLITARPAQFGVPIERAGENLDLRPGGMFITELPAPDRGLRASGATGWRCDHHFDNYQFRTQGG